MSPPGSLFDEPDDRRIYGVVLAGVTNHQDPEGLGRVKLRYPWLSDEVESGWARVATAMSGGGWGLFLLPEVGDEVLVLFERGDMNYPFVVGSLWHAEARPPADNGDGKNAVRLLRSRSGHLVQLDDSDGSEKILIRDRSGKNEIVIDTASNTIAIRSDQDLRLEAKGKIALVAGGAIELEGASLAVEVKESASLRAQIEVGIEGPAGVKLNRDGLVVR